VGYCPAKWSMLVVWHAAGTSEETADPAACLSDWKQVANAPHQRPAWRS
jgi:hypothetical protein